MNIEQARARAVASFIQHTHKNHCPAGTVESAVFEREYQHLLEAQRAAALSTAGYVEAKKDGIH